MGGVSKLLYNAPRTARRATKAKAYKPTLFVIAIVVRLYKSHRQHVRRPIKAGQYLQFGWYGIRLKLRLKFTS